MTPTLVFGISDFGGYVADNYISYLEKYQPGLMSITKTNCIGVKENAVKLIDFSDIESLTKEYNPLTNENKASSREPIKILLEREYNSLNTLNENNNISNSTSIELILPLFRKESVDVLEVLLESLYELESQGVLSNFSVCVYVIPFDHEKDEKLNSSELISEKIVRADLLGQFEQLINSDHAQQIISHVFYFNDKNVDNKNLQFSIDNLSIAIHEFISIKALKHYQVLGGAVNNQRDLVFGLSIYRLNGSFVKEYVTVQLLLDKLLNGELPDRLSLDISRVKLQTDSILNNNKPIILTSYRGEIEGLVEDVNISESEIVAKVDEIIVAKIQKLKDEIIDLVHSFDITLESQRALLSYMLGENDKLLSGELNNEDNYSILDIEMDAYDFYNKKLPPEKQYDRTELKLLDKEIVNTENFIETITGEINDLAADKDLLKQDTSISFNDGIFSVDGKSISVNGYVEPEGPNNWPVYLPSISSPHTSVDLSNHFNEVRDQKGTNSCTGFVVSSLYEYASSKNNNLKVEVSPLFVYYNARKSINNEGKDIGSSLRSVLEKVQETGACFESNWPFGSNRVLETPNNIAYEEGRKHLANEIFSVELTETSFENCLTEGMPIVFGLKIYKSFYKTNRGLVGPPSMEELNSEQFGLHAMVAVGYSNKERLLKVRNSWGKDWGDQGYCFIPYDYVFDLDFVSECLTIKSFNDVSYSENSVSNHGNSYFFSLQDINLNYVLKSAEVLKLSKTIQNLRNKRSEILEEIKEKQLEFRTPGFRQDLLEKNLQKLTPHSSSGNDRQNNQKINYLYKIIALVLPALIVLIIGVILNKLILFSLIAITVGIISFIIYDKIIKTAISRSKNNQLRNQVPNNSVQLLDKKRIKAEFKIAASIIDKFPSFISELRDYHKQYSLFVTGCKDFSQELIERDKELLEQQNIISPLFVKDILSQNEIDQIIDAKKRERIQGDLDLLKVFKLNYRAFSDQEKFRKNNRESLLGVQKKIEDMNEELDQYSISRLYLKQDEFEFMKDQDPFEIVVGKMENLSKPFANYISTLEQSYHRLFFADVTSANELYEIIEDNLSNRPLLVEINNKLKFTYLTLDTNVKLENLAFYKELKSYS